MPSAWVNHYLSSDVPYLRVANVQDGFLALDEIKTITIRRGEQQQYALAPGDLVMTEGGDQDKLGRALRDPLILPYEINKTKPFLNRRLALESLQGGAL